MCAISRSRRKLSFSASQWARHVGLVPSPQSQGADSLLGSKKTVSQYGTNTSVVFTDSVYRTEETTLQTFGKDSLVDSRSARALALASERSEHEDDA